MDEYRNWLFDGVDTSAAYDATRPGVIAGWVGERNAGERMLLMAYAYKGWEGGDMDPEALRVALLYAYYGFAPLPYWEWRENGYAETEMGLFDGVDISAAYDDTRPGVIAGWVGGRYAGERMRLLLAGGLDDGLSNNGLRVAMALAYRGWTGSVDWEWLLAVTGLSQNQLKRGIANCQKCGYLREMAQIE